MKTSFLPDLSCMLCNDEDSCEDDLDLTCFEILSDEGKPSESGITYNLVFGLIEQQIRAVQLFKRLVRKFKLYLDVMSRESR